MNRKILSLPAIGLAMLLTIPGASAGSVVVNQSGNTYTTVVQSGASTRTVTRTIRPDRYDQVNKRAEVKANNVANRSPVADRVYCNMGVVPGNRLASGQRMGANIHAANRLVANQAANRFGANQAANRFGANNAFVSQNGRDNTATATQSGTNNASYIVQQGDNHTAHTVQTGDNNIALIIQRC